jgi:hypothetical protein
MSRICLIMVVFLGSLISCSSGSGGLEPVNPPIVNKTPTILTNFTDTTVVFGDTVNITGTVKDYTSLLVNNEKADAINVTLNSLIKETIIPINALNKDVSAAKTVTVHVGDWTTSFFGLCTNGIWVRDPNYRQLSSSGEFIRNGTWVGPIDAMQIKSNFEIALNIGDNLTSWASYNYTWNKGLVKFGNGSNFLIKSVDLKKMITISLLENSGGNLTEETWIKQ